MSYPFSEDAGHIAVEPDGEAARSNETTLLSVLEVGGRLYWRVFEALESVGLTQPGYEVLAHLRADGGSSGLDGLAHQLRRPIREVSALVEELDEQGLVLARADREPGPVRVTLTRLGSERARDGRTRLDAILREFSARVGVEERLALDRLLSKIER